MKKRGAILSLVSLVLIVAAIIGTVILTRKIGDELDALGEDSDVTTEIPKDTSGSGSEDTSSSESEASAFYIDQATQTGYRTVNGTTYFFFVVEPTSRYLSVFYGADTFASYSVLAKYSLDGIAWNSYFDSIEGSSGMTCQDVQDMSSVDKVYVAYTSIEGCTDPMFVLEDLKQNVFFDQSMFKVSFVSSVG